MKIAVLGTGMVGEALATRLAELGHDVMMGARERDNKRALAWAEGQGARSAGDFAAAAAFAEVVFIAVRGTASRDAAEQAGPAALAGKIVVDVTNPLIFVEALPPMRPHSFRPHRQVLSHFRDDYRHAGDSMGSKTVPNVSQMETVSFPIGVLRPTPWPFAPHVFAASLQRPPGLGRVSLAPAHPTPQLAQVPSQPGRRLCSE